MDYDEATNGPTKDDLLRDSIFRVRLDLEQIRRSGNLHLLNSAQARLRLLMREQQIIESNKMKRRPK